MWVLFGQLLETFGQLFTLTSGHTDCSNRGLLEEPIDI